MAKCEKVCLHDYEDCGHHCYGVSGESTHPPCLHPECSGVRNELTQNADELCVICYVEGMSVQTHCTY